MADGALHPRGRVSLVGGGPGDPSLLTLRAAELLRTADVVAYDLLVPEALVAMAGPQAELIAVGRRVHGPSSCEYRCHPAVLERARAGLHVVRLKAGDPFLFGRGGEEAEELLEEGIPFEIVPGVSAAFGAAARAGIPLTHRDYASDLVIATGHDLENGRPSKSDWSHVGAARGTVVLYMASRKLEANLQRLMDRGRAPETPAAYVASASTPGQTVIVATLGTLAAAASHVDRAAPAVIIVGEVVALRQKLATFEQGRLPLAGRRVLVGRARPGASALATSLRGLGATVVEAPWMTVAPVSSPEELDWGITLLGQYDGAVFASAPAVEAFCERLAARCLDVRDLPATPFFAVGAEAAKRLRAAGFLAERVSEGACAPALSRAFGRPQGKAVVVFGAEGGRRDLCDELAKLGMRVEYKGIYRVQVQWPRHGVPAADLVVLPSSTAATLLLDGPPGGSLRGLPMVAIGEKTERAARTLGARDVVRSNQDTRESVVEAVLALFGKDQRTPEGARAAKSSVVAHPSPLNPVTQEASHV